MPISRLTRYLCAPVLLLVLGSAAQAATLQVNCGAKVGFATIGAALKVLQGALASGPNTINVSGACHENILINNMDLLTITGSNGASITDASGDTADVVDIRTSRVTISGMTIDGLNGVNYDTVDCEQGSQCRLIGNTLQGGTDAVGVYPLSRGLIYGGVIQNATSSGILAWGDLLAAGITVQGNPIGVSVQNGGRARVRGADPASDPILTITPATIANNNGGVLVSQGAEFTCAGCVVRDNAGDGIHLDVSAAATIQGRPAITHNSGYGVYVGDLSSATFKGPPSTVTGNGQPNILCNSPTAVTRGALAAAGGAANTNCTN
jgi:nitrous oxidase accessory protein NosD